MLMLGEVQTHLLKNSLPLPARAVAELLAPRPGSRVTAVDRPINRTVSADALIGVDCPLPSEPKRRARGIGTVAGRAVVVGGLVAQASARARLVWTKYRERRPWSHYTRNRGTIEVLGNASAEQVREGFLTLPADPDFLDLGGICQRQLDEVQVRPQLDYRVPLKTRPTFLRWTAVADDRATPSVHLHMDDETTRSVRLVLPTGLMPEAARFCEDLAAHDWLYTTMQYAISDAEDSIARKADPLGVLQATLTLLVRLWMPGAHVASGLKPLWADLEESPGFTAPWERHVAWVRDQVAVSTLRALHEVRG